MSLVRILSFSRTKFIVRVGRIEAVRMVFRVWYTINYHKPVDYLVLKLVFVIIGVNLCSCTIKFCDPEALLGPSM